MATEVESNGLISLLSVQSKLLFSFSPSWYDECNQTEFTEFVISRDFQNLHGRDKLVFGNGRVPIYLRKNDCADFFLQVC